MPPVNFQPGQQRDRAARISAAPATVSTAKRNALRTLTYPQIVLAGVSRALEPKLRPLTIGETFRQKIVLVPADGSRTAGIPQTSLRVSVQREPTPAEIRGAHLSEGFLGLLNQWLAGLGYGPRSEDTMAYYDQDGEYIQIQVKREQMKRGEKLRKKLEALTRTNGDGRLGEHGVQALIHFLQRGHDPWLELDIVGELLGETGDIAAAREIVAEMCPSHPKSGERLMHAYWLAAKSREAAADRA